MYIKNFFFLGCNACRWKITKPSSFGRSFEKEMHQILRQRICTMYRYKREVIQLGTTETRPRFSFARANCLSLSEYARDQSPWGPRPRATGVNLITVN